LSFKCSFVVFVSFYLFVYDLCMLHVMSMPSESTKSLELKVDDDDDDDNSK